MLKLQDCVDHKIIHIAIDGPAGAGKSTVARLLAARLGIAHLDTGAMYRALTYKVLQAGISLQDEEEISRIALSTQISFQYGELEEVFCDGVNVTQQIRGSDVDKAVSIVASYRGVRQRMVELQRQMAQKGSLVMDGRDIGTIVLPSAAVKIYLTASSEERARRRFLENGQNDGDNTLKEVIMEIENRDRLDSERKYSPLKPAEDAIIVDTTGLAAGEAVNKIENIIREEKGEFLFIR